MTSTIYVIIKAVSKIQKISERGSLLYRYLKIEYIVKQQTQNHTTDIVKHMGLPFSDLSTQNLD